MKADEIINIQSEEQEYAPYQLPAEPIRCAGCNHILTPVTTHKDSEICIDCYLQEVEFRNEYGTE
jgi:hypothetical protein